MKLVIQRVKSAKVIKTKTGQVVGEIGRGLFVLLGIKRGDTENTADNLVGKLIKLRVMGDKSGKMNLSIVDAMAEVLLVSQFTLLANTKDGNRPSFLNAEEPKKAKKLYEYIVAKLEKTGLNIQTGSFGDYMEIEVALDGPVTIVLES